VRKFSHSLRILTVSTGSQTAQAGFLLTIVSIRGIFGLWHIGCFSSSLRWPEVVATGFESLIQELLMRINRIKLTAVILFAFPLLLLAMFQVTPARVAASMPDDPAAMYKTKCAACHTPTASKFFDPAHSEEVHVHAILMGKKGEKPPNMPAFGEKGMTENEAKSLAAYMKTLRPSTN
jgi:mono/diheme cytochrome c family protein